MTSRDLPGAEAAATETASEEDRRCSMTGLQVVGALIVAAFFAALVAMTAQALGWRGAIALWTVSIAATAVLVVGVMLLTGEIA